MTPSRADIHHAVDVELSRAYAKHGTERWSRHEFKGVIDEEYDEMWDAIKKDAPSHELVAEVIEVAAMCFRFLETSVRRNALVDAVNVKVVEVEMEKLAELGIPPGDV